MCPQTLYYLYFAVGHDDSQHTYHTHSILYDTGINVYFEIYLKSHLSVWSVILVWGGACGVVFSPFIDRTADC